MIRSDFVPCPGDSRALFTLAVAVAGGLPEYVITVAVKRAESLPVPRQTGHRSGQARQHAQQAVPHQLPGTADGRRPSPASSGRAEQTLDPGSALLLVLERELQLRTVGDRPVLQVDVLLDDLSYPQIADRPSGDPDRLRRRILP